MRLFINNLTPEYPDPEDEAYWDFMADSLNMRRYDDEGTRLNSIDLTMTTQQGARTHITQVVSFRAPHNGKPPVLEIHCDAAQAEAASKRCAGASNASMRRVMRRAR